MAIHSGDRFKIPFDDVFPEGCYVLSVERAQDDNNGKPKPATDHWVSYISWAKQKRSALPAGKQGAGRPGSGDAAQKPAA
jgi:hypothetical protein